MVPHRKSWFWLLGANGGGAILMTILRLGPADTITAVAGSQDNVAPDNDPINTLNRVSVDTTAGAATFTGLEAGLDGQLLWVLNTGANTLTLANENVASLAANRFHGSGDLTVLGGDSLLIYYDSTLARWVMGV